MSKSFRVVPVVQMFDTCKEFCEAYQIGEGDLIFTNPAYFEGLMDSYASGATVVYFKNYGKGEPTDVMIEALYQDIRDIPFQRLIAVGGGSIIDVAKLLVQETVLPIEELYAKKIPTKKVKELIIVPTTCGTGSELTSVSVIELTKQGTKLGLQTDEQFADAAVLIPEMLNSLPAGPFGKSAIDALIHASESFLSPKASAFTQMYSETAIRLLLRGFLQIQKHGIEERKKYNKEFLYASAMAGIAFGNAGCAAVHAMSMSFASSHHVAHGEANYALFTEVFQTYQKMQPKGEIEKYNAILSQELGCEEEVVYEKLEEVLNCVLEKKTLRFYGVTEEELPVYTKTVMEKQGRLTANNYVPLTGEDVLRIYQALL